MSCYKFGFKQFSIVTPKRSNSISSKLGIDRNDRQIKYPIFKTDMANEIISPLKNVTVKILLISVKKIKFSTFKTKQIDQSLHVSVCLCR